MSKDPNDSPSLWQMFLAWKNRKTKPIDFYKTPRGKREGKLQGHIEVRAGKPKKKDLVAVTFDKPIDYLEMTPREAVELATALKKICQQVRSEKKVSKIISIK